MDNDTWSVSCLSHLCTLLLLVLIAILHPAHVYCATTTPIHCSDRFACDNSNYLTEDDCINNGGVWDPDRKWAGGWGVTGGKYGEFTCKTCHIRKSPNIKRVKPFLSAPNGIDQLPIETATAPYNAVVFRSMKEGSSDFGNDEGGRTFSVKICESCHTTTSYHRYNTTIDPDDGGPLGAQTEFYHFNNADCIQCHKHSDGFKPSCAGCHAYPPAWQSHGSHFYPGVTSNIPTCATCHETSVHLNGLSEIRFDSSDWMVSGGSYDGIEPSRYMVETGYNSTTPAYGRCDNIYCHSNAQPDGGVGLPQIITIPTWGDSNVATCGFCHQSGVHGDTGPQIDSGSHTVHLGYGFSSFNTPENPIKCTACHTANTIPPKVGAPAFNCSGCHSVHNPDVIFPLFQAMHVDGEVTINLHPFFGNGTYNGTPAPGDGYGSCSNLYCHSDGTSLATTVIPGNTAPGWGGSSLVCDSCHENGPTYANGTPKANSHAAHLAQSFTCDQCHYTTTNDGASISSRDTHVNLAYDVDPGSGVSFSYVFNAGVGTCSNISCHGNTDADWGATACLGCHSVVQGARAAAGGQFSSNSHHIQADTITDAHCYECHWEANSDGTIAAAYHGGTKISGAQVDLVIYGASTRPTAYSIDVTAIQYTADVAPEVKRDEVEKLNSHCLSCHSDDNNDTRPFLYDTNTPKQYAWDGTSVASRYSQLGTTSLGKYPTVPNAAQKIQTKAYSAHGNATGNQGGWSSGAAPAGTGVDDLLPNTRSGTVNVACYDCHNSHGSNVSGKTTSYNSATVNGGLLKETKVGEGGYSVPYKPVAGGSIAEKNLRTAGASLCMDCHLTASGGVNQPWGYLETYGAAEKIIGYYDSPYFSPGTAGPKVRYPFMAANDYKGGHFGASSDLETPAMGSIDGLCTPCHDPHGVSPTLSSNQQYGVPLLKGTWLTSPYKEDVPPSTNSLRSARSGNRYIYIDGTTFGSHISQLVQGIGETEDQFGGLCLRCHPKTSLTDGTTHTWKSKDRVHEAVKGWDSSGVTKHNFSCSKCHTPHLGSVLPRLMVTNCMDSRHKGRVVNQVSPAIEDLETWWDEATYDGKCGSGRIPGSYTNCTGSWIPQVNTFACHEEQNGYANQGTDQSWNAVTPWAPDFYVDPLPYVTSAAKSATPGKVRFYVRWGTNLASNSSIDFGLTPDYGRTASTVNFVTNHAVPADALDNHNTYYYQVRSNTSGGDQVTFGNQSDLSYYISIPPDPVSLIPKSSQVCSGASINVNLAWNATQDVDGGPIEYYLEVDDTPSFSSPNANSGWVTGTSATVGPLNCNDTWYWHVKARDANHIEAETNWTSRSSFDLGPAPTKPATPTLTDEPDFECGGNCSVSLLSSAVANPYPLLYGGVQYYFEVDDDPGFGSPDKIRTWTTSRTASITGLDGDKTWYFRVKARYTNFPALELESDWSPYKQFTIIYPSPSTPTALFTQDVVSPGSATLTWSPSTAENSGPVEYALQIDDDPNFTSVDYSDSWLPGTNWSTGSLSVGTWYWQVMARDVDHPTAESAWSNSGEFKVWATAPASKTITFSWPDVPVGSITIDGVPYGGPAGSVVVEIADLFIAEVVGAPGQVGGGEPDGNWEYFASQASGGNPGYIAATFTPNDGNSFTVKVGSTPSYQATGGAGGGASSIAKDGATTMYAAGAGGGGGGEAAWWEEQYEYAESGYSGFAGESFGSAAGGAGGAGSTCYCTSGAGTAGSPGGQGGSGAISVTSMAITGSITLPRVTITTRFPGPAAPTLDWTGEANYLTDGVDPENGAQLSDFTFRVKYTDIDDDSPWPIEVWIDRDDSGSYDANEKFDMGEVDGGDTDFTDGKLYAYSMAMPYAGDGILNYRFYASDGASSATGTPTAEKAITVFNVPPNTPDIISPADGAIDVPQPIVLVASAFVDPDAADTHQSSQWLVSSVSGAEFNNNLLYDSGASEPTTLHTPGVAVVQGTTYFWMVRYQDNHGGWSAYSTEASFTLLDNAPPNTPVNVTPANSAEDVATQVRLEAGDFSDPEIGDSHQGSIWQVSTQSGENFVAGRIYNSGAVAATTSYVVPVTLDPKTVYFWRVSYQDDKNQWSAFSADTRFKTTSIESYYRFDEGAGTAVADSVGSNNGWLQNAATGAIWISGFNGGSALRFDGIDDGVAWNYTNGRPSNNFALEAMVKAATTHETSDAEATTGTGGTGGQKYLFEASFIADPGAGAGVSLGTNGVSVYEHSGGYMPPLARYVPSEKSQPELGNDWNHVIVSYEDRQPRIYVNGRLVHVGLQSLKTTVYAPIVLANGGYGKFAGDIDEVVIHKVPLSEAEALERCIEVGKCTDADIDSDGLADSTDNCPFDYNPGQEDLDNDEIGNVCEYLSFWRMDDGIGSIAADETGDHDLALNGGTTWSAGVNGGGLLFDGVNVDTGAENILDNYAGDFSLSIWLKFPAGAVNPKWSFGKGLDPYRSLGVGIGHWVDTDVPVAPVLFVNDGTPGAFLDPEYEWPHRLSLSAGTIPRDTWGHFVWTIDRTNHVMKAYRNGQYISERDISILGTNALTDDKLFKLGSAGEASSQYTGSMDNAAVYEFVLQPADVHDLCEAGAGVGNCP